MRRSDREITDPEAIARFLSRQQVMRVGLYDDGEIYIVPVNYGYAITHGATCFYFHGAKAGRKYALAQAAPRVGFEIDGDYRPLPADNACDCSAAFQSVIGNGVLSLVDDEEEKRSGLDAIMRQLTGNSSFAYAQEMLRAVAVFKLTVAKLSCKAKDVRP